MIVEMSLPNEQPRNSTSLPPINLSVTSPEKALLEDQKPLSDSHVDVNGKWTPRPSAPNLVGTQAVDRPISPGVRWANEVVDSSDNHLPKVNNRSFSGKWQMAG